MSKVMRSVKNVTKGYSTAQVKVREGMRMHLISIHDLRGFNISFHSDEQRRMGSYWDANERDLSDDIFLVRYAR